MPNVGDIIYLSDLLPLFDLLNHNSNYIIGQIIAVPLMVRKYQEIRILNYLPL